MRDFSFKKFSTLFRVRYNAARGLIYLGHFNINGIHIFSALEGKEISCFVKS